MSTAGVAPNKNMLSGMDPLLTLSGDEFVEVVKLTTDGKYKNYRVLASKLKATTNAYDFAVANGFVGTLAQWLECTSALYARDPAAAGKVLVADGQGVGQWTEVGIGIVEGLQEELDLVLAQVRAQAEVASDAANAASQSSTQSTAAKNAAINASGTASGYATQAATSAAETESDRIVVIATRDEVVAIADTLEAMKDDAGLSKDAAALSAAAALLSEQHAATSATAADAAASVADGAKDAVAASATQALGARDSSEAFAVNALIAAGQAENAAIQAQQAELAAKADIGQVREDLANPLKGAKEIAFGGDQPTVDAALMTRAKGNAGKTYNLIGAAVRRDTLISPNWHLVSDSAHIPVNMAEPTEGVELQLNYTGSKIGTLVVGSDERLAGAGVMAGGSVGADKAYLRMGAPCSYTVNMATSEIIYDARFYRLARFGISIAPTGLITLTHPQRQLNLMPLIQYFSEDSSVELMFPFDIRTNGVSLTTLYIKRRMSGRINYNGAVWAASNSPFNADFTFAYDVPTGVLTVTHPLITGNVQPNITPYSNAADEYYVSVFNSTGTGFQVKFRKLTDGSIPAGTPTGMGFYFDRGISAIDKVPSGKLHVHLGHVQVDMRDVDFPLANIWPLALMEA
ncbi:hypothetical protein D3C81_364380 [compost metagenome]